MVRTVSGQESGWLEITNLIDMWGHGAVGLLGYRLGLLVLVVRYRYRYRVELESESEIKMNNSRPRLGLGLGTNVLCTMYQCTIICDHMCHNVSYSHTV